MQLLKASQWRPKLFLYSAVKACSFDLNPVARPSLNQIDKPASKIRRILLAVVFHFVAAMEEQLK